MSKLTVKPGDQVLVGRRGQSDLCTVERVTPSGRFFVRRNADWIQEFNADGWERGGSENVWRREFVTIATPELIAEREHEMAHKDLVRQLGRVNWAALPLDRLQQVVAIIAPPTDHPLSAAERAHD